MGQHLAHRAGGAGRRGNDVLRGSPAAPQVLVRHVGQTLIVGVGVDRGDEALFQAETLVEDLGDRGQAVGRARGVGDDAVLRSKLVVVDADDDRGVDLVLGRHGQDHALGSGVEVLFQRRSLAKHARGFDHELYAEVTPRDLRGVAVFGHDDLLVVDVHRVAVDADRSFEAAHHRVVLQQVGQLFVVEQVVDRHDLDVVASAEDAKDTATDTSESVDAYGCLHHAASRFISLNRWIRSTTRWA